MAKSNRKELMGILGAEMKKRNTAGGFVVVNEASKRTPVGTPESTGIEGYQGGRLRSNNTSEADESGFIAGNDTSYTRPVHNGTYYYRHDGQWTRAELAELDSLAGDTGDGEGGKKGMKARPFLVEGFFASVPQLERIYGAEIKARNR